MIVISTTVVVVVPVAMGLVVVTPLVFLRLLTIDPLTKFALSLGTLLLPAIIDLIKPMNRIPLLTWLIAVRLGLFQILPGP